MEEGRYVIVLKGKAKEIWEKIPKGLRSHVVSYLLVDAWNMEKLNPFISRSKENSSPVKKKTKAHSFYSKTLQTK